VGIGLKQMNIKPASQRKKAFTIVEVLVSVCIIGISAAGLMASFRFALFSIQMARENQRATQITLERAEAIRCFNWDRILAGDVPTEKPDYYNPATQSPPVYTVRTTISDFSPSDGSPSYAGNMKTLTIIVSWQTGHVSRSRTNITYIAKDGIQNYVF
jgi:type II secretory pathway pseudopilin PulG